MSVFKLVHQVRFLFLCSVLLCFQNCGKFVPNENVTEVLPETTKIEMAEAKAVFFRYSSFRNRIGDGVKRGGWCFRLDLANGVIVDESGVKRGAVPTEKMLVLREILLGEDICETKTQFPPETICTFALLLPYAALDLSEEKLSVLGPESGSGCVSQKLDFCKREKKIEFNNILSEVERGLGVTGFNSCQD